MSKWVREEDLAEELGITLFELRLLARREGWNRITSGRAVAYYRPDVERH